MNSKDYWAERARADKIKVIKTGEKGIDNLKRLLKTNLDDVENKIKAFYDKYADNYSEQLPIKDLQKYKAELKKAAIKNPKDKTLNKLLKEDIPKYKIDRLRALQTELQIQLAEATAGQEKGIYKTLNDVGKVSQATLAQTFKKTIGLEFNTLASKKMKQLLSSDWSGMNWSERLWKDRELVGKKVTEILEKGIPQGTSLQTMSRELKNATGTSFNDAFRLIRTETSHIDGAVTLEGYKQAKEELGIEYYEYDAFLDSRTSSICEELNGQRFRIDEAEVGVNYPPMHPNCRSTTQLVLDENYKKEEKEADKKIDALNHINLETKKDINLPRLGKYELKEINSQDKPIMLKQNIINRNKIQHPDLEETDQKQALSALYKNDLILNDLKKSNYYHFIKKSEKINYVTLLDITENKDNFEIVHYHKINDKNLKKLIKKNTK